MTTQVRACSLAIAKDRIQQHDMVGCLTLFTHSILMTSTIFMASYVAIVHCRSQFDDQILLVYYTNNFEDAVKENFLFLQSTS